MTTTSQKLFSHTSLVPLSKIVNAPTRSVRVLWSIFTGTMIMGLVACTTLAVIQYCRHQTVFQLDYSGKNVKFDKIPSVTVCLKTKDVALLFQNAVKQHFESLNESLGTRLDDKNFPWASSNIKSYFLSVTSKLHILKHQLPTLAWNTSIARSPFYKMMHNFSISFKVDPNSEDVGYELVVYEQVPHVKSFLCTTFEFISPKSQPPWSQLNMTVTHENSRYKVDQVQNSAKEVDAENWRGYPITVIVHEPQSMPFSAYDRHIHETVEVGKQKYIFFSKSVTKRMNTERNPCQGSTNQQKLELFGNAYDYSHETCAWTLCCEKTKKFCNCTCRMDVLRSSLMSCPDSCKVCLSKVSYGRCPSACISTKYNKYSSLYMEPLPSNQNRMILVKSDNVQIATEEEIYTLTKLFSEIGGLCSLFIGFSCIFIFEIFEALIVWHKVKNSSKGGTNLSSSDDLLTKTALNINKSNNSYCNSNPNSKQEYIQDVQFELEMSQQQWDAIQNRLNIEGRTNINKQELKELLSSSQTKLKIIVK